jgi:hypothetical protein
VPDGFARVSNQFDWIKENVCSKSKSENTLNCIPTANPTKIPSLSPTTANPTKIPTLSPTVKSTKATKNAKSAKMM